MFVLNRFPLHINLDEGAVLLVNKPLEWTSFDVVNKIKMLIIRYAHRHLNADEAGKIKFKIGHAGTLDPLATGLLIVCLGKETKNIEKYMGLEKEYTGTFYIGKTTPSFDLETPVDNYYPTEHITGNMIADAAKKLTGQYMQVPPVYSAIKKKGKRAYEYARTGEQIMLEPKPVTINLFEITNIDFPYVDFRIICSKGTYIRSIARDFGKTLNSGAHLTKLCRTRIGNFTLENALNMNVITNAFEENLHFKSQSGS